MSAIIKGLIETIGLGRLRVVVRGSVDYRRDPLSHPALARMSLSELGDLPACELRARGGA